VDPRTRAEGTRIRYTPHLYSLWDHVRLCVKWFPGLLEEVQTMKGFASCHPDVVLLLQHLGVENWMVTQGLGYAAASAGSHGKVGTYQGVDFGYCVDLAISLATRPFVDKMAASGFASWARIGPAWAGNEHIHAVYAGALPKDGGGVARRLPLPERQITDWIRSLNGLRGHAHMLPLWDPDPAQEAFLHAVRDAGDRVRPVVVKLGKQVVPCVAVLALGATRVELRPVAEALGLEVAKLVAEPFPGMEMKDEGSYMRCGLRALVEGAGRKLKWSDPDPAAAPIATIT